MNNNKRGNKHQQGSTIKQNNKSGVCQVCVVNCDCGREWKGSPLVSTCLTILPTNHHKIYLIPALLINNCNNLTLLDVLFYQPTTTILTSTCPTTVYNQQQPQFYPPSAPTILPTINQILLSNCFITLPTNNHNPTLRLLVLFTNHQSQFNPLPPLLY